MLTPRPTTPAQALDLAFRRQKPTRQQLDDFLRARQRLLESINPAENEEHLKKLLIDFLAHPGVLGPDYYLNITKRRDLAIRTGPKETAPVGVLVEVKKATTGKGVVNKEMVTTTDLNRKAFQELLLYYLEDREDKSGNDLRRLVITNGVEWFVFDALDFDRLFWRDTELRKDFRTWAAKGKANGGTDFFYKEIAQPFLAALDAELPFAYLDLRPAPATERDLITSAKLFEAPHLLKMPFAQDANTLNRAFYEELLYLIGLEEVKEKSRKLIKRVAPVEREHQGSLLRNTLDILRSDDLLGNLSGGERAAYGADPEKQLFGVALELCLTWVNRLLFLKLLEGQLRRYHAGNDSALTEPYRFLTPELIPNFGTLNELFFEVLNQPTEQRSAAIRRKYGRLPYLNSSLYEPSDLERRTLRVGNLKDSLTLPLHRKSVLPAQAAPPETLSYLLRFLDAYDFASEGDEQVQDTHKPLISAAVLGLIFEKLNGYQDGSFYTPGFITMYMARQTLRRAVVQHFNRRYGFGAADVAELADALNAKQRPEYSTHFNTLTVLDPAVGSGHFLVSALNELLAIKSELGLLLDAETDPATGATTYQRLRYRLSVARDELVVMHEDDDPQNPGALFQYHARLDPLTGQRSVAPAHTKLQRALFQEKRHLMEHALFGVDLNPNSVRICRLRLWIELLKHAYYRPETGFEQLETLPNLELNVKVGNSLLSRFSLDADLSDVFRQGKFTLATYRDVVHAYFNSRDRTAKQELQQFLGDIKEQFTATIYRGDPLRRDVSTLKAELLRVEMDARPDLFGKVKLTEEEAWEKTTVLTMRLKKAEEKLAHREKGALYRDAFEWRFEFPEVLDEKGRFRGFDVVIGNPPYIRQEELAPVFKQYLKNTFVTGTGTADLYVYFYELGISLLTPGGELSFITNNKWLRAGYGKGLRGYLLNPKLQLIELLDFGDLQIFAEATTYPNILTIKNSISGNDVLRVAELKRIEINNFSESVETVVLKISSSQLNADLWSFASAEKQSALDKLNNNSKTLEHFLDEKIYNGIKTGYNNCFVINKSIRDDLISADLNCSHYIKPFLEGRDVKRYRQSSSETFIIYITWNTEFELLPKPLQQHLLTHEYSLELLLFVNQQVK